MCKNSHIIDSSYEWYLKVNDLVMNCMLVTIVRAKDHVRASASRVDRSIAERVL